MKRTGEGLLIPLLIVFLLAFVIRIFPLVWSPYPYNIDGLGEAMLADNIYSSGGMSLPLDAGYKEGYIYHMPLMNTLLALASDVFGVEPLMLAQIFIAAIGALSCVGAMLVVHMITESRRASVIAGLFMALLGTYVYCTSSVWKETLGLTMLVIIAGLYVERKSIRIRTILTVALFMMVFIHHHSAVIASLFFSFAVAADSYLSLKQKKWSWQNNADIATLILLWVLVEYYYSGIELPYYNFITPDQDLYLLIAVSCVLAALMFIFIMGRRVDSKLHYLKILFPVVGAFLIVANHFFPLFPGTQGTRSPVLLFASAYLIMMIPMWYGAESLLRANPKWAPALYALLWAPLAMIFFALLRSLDATSHMIIARTFDFLDLGMAALFAAGAIVLIKNVKRLGPVIVIFLLIIVAITAPLAFQTEQLFGVQNQTYEYEVDAYDWIHSMSPDGDVDSDQRIATSSQLLFNLSANADLPYRIETGASVSSNQWFVLEGSWTATGAQEYPAGQVVLKQSDFDDFLDSQNVLWVSGPADNQMIVAINPQTDS